MRTALSTRRRPSVLIALVLLGVLPSSGCFSYHSVEGPVPVGKNVRLVLASEGRTIMQEKFGLEVVMVDGIVQETTANGMVANVEVGFVPIRAIRMHGMRYQQVVFPPAAIARVEARGLNAFRTGVFALATAGVVAAFIITKISCDNCSKTTP